MKNKSTIIPAQPGYKLVQVFPDEDFATWIEPIIAFEVSGDDVITVNPIIIDGKYDAHNAVISPDGTVTEMDNQTFDTFEEFLDQFKVTWKKYNKKASK